MCHVDLTRIVDGHDLAERFQDFPKSVQLACRMRGEDIVDALWSDTLNILPQSFSVPDGLMGSEGADPLLAFFSAGGGDDMLTRYEGLDQLDHHGPDSTCTTDDEQSP